MKAKIEKNRQSKILTKDNLYKQSHINFQLLCKELAHQTRLEVLLLKKLIEQFKHIIDNQPNSIMVEDPALVIGDIHGQFYDLLKILSHANIFRGDKKLKTKFVFLGDYVDRGINAIQVMVLLICLKIEYPTNIILLRGNHESRIMTSQYNFKSECCTKYSQEIYDRMMEAFDLLPLVSIINNSYFCVHGGISDKMIDIKKINSIHRKQQIPVTQSAYCDFIWADPIQDQNGALTTKTVFNKARDCSILYGAQLVQEFLKFNQLSTIIRGHQIFFQGYKAYNWGEIKQNSSVITIFSAPNYCGSCKNKAAVLKIQNNTFKIKQFEQQQPEKYKFLAKFDVFSWTFPQIIQNTKEILKQMMQSITQAYIPELQNIPTDKKIAYFVDYAISQKILKPISHKQIPKPKKGLTAQQQRNYLFNRSQQYYAQSQKLPAHH